MPTLELCTQRKKGANRTFNEDNYVRTEWLTGSAKLQRLFCWPCLLFDKDSCSLNNPWATSGFIDLANLSRAIERHGKSKNHIDCAVSAGECVRTCRLDNRRVQVLHLCEMIPGAVITHLVTLLTTPLSQPKKMGFP